jgi:cytochrome c553
MNLRAAFTVLLVVAAVVIAACFSSPEETARQEEIRRDGMQAYAAETCAACHGAERQGGKTGPPLQRLHRHWSEDELVAFLRTPASALASSSRLQEVSRQYKVQMAGLPAASEEKLRTLARYLLLD